MSANVSFDVEDISRESGWEFELIKKSTVFFYLFDKKW
jgi:hypothetical protein